MFHPRDSFGQVKVIPFRMVVLEKLIAAQQAKSIPFLLLNVPVSYQRFPDFDCQFGNSYHN
jgi:hypothetical protein